jgi:hypothetical protein
MKAADIPTDTLLAYTTSRDPFEYGGKATRAIVVDKAKHVERRDRDWSGVGFSKDSSAPSYRTTGMLAVVEMRRWSGDQANPVTDANMATAAEAVRRAMERDGVVMLNMALPHPNLRVALVTGRALHMPWAEYRAGVEKRDEARRRRDAENDAHTAAQEAARDRLRALGLEHLPSQPTYQLMPNRMTWSALEELINEAVRKGYTTHQEAGEES